MKIELLENMYVVRETHLHMLLLPLLQVNVKHQAPLSFKYSNQFVNIVQIISRINKKII